METDLENENKELKFKIRRLELENQILKEKLDCKDRLLETTTRAFKQAVHDLEHPGEDQFWTPTEPVKPQTEVLTSDGDIIYGC